MQKPLWPMAVMMVILALIAMAFSWFNYAQKGGVTFSYILFL